MVPLKLNPESIVDGVYILSKVENTFENIYLKVREKEKRIYSDEEINHLPFATKFTPHKKEWELRAKSFLRFKDYLKTKNGHLNILDLGCGSGWFSGQLSNIFKHLFLCVDVNLKELKQGCKIFSSEHIKFIYANILSTDVAQATFDLIILNAAIQYFPDLKILFTRLSNLLNKNGEIHIIDSPFYSKNEVDYAKNRTYDYYESIGFPEMANNYFHHSLNELSEYGYETLYNPYSIRKKIKRMFFIKDSPFPWIRVSK